MTEWSRESRSGQYDQIRNFGIVVSYKILWNYDPKKGNIGADGH